MAHCGCGAAAGASFGERAEVLHIRRGDPKPRRSWPRSLTVSEAFQPRSDFLRALIERGYVHQCSDLAGLDDKALSGSLVAYIGFDCTAPSLHVGSLLQIMMLHWLQRSGGKPLALMGGGTTMVGDPSGKDESRKLLTVEQIEANKAGIRKVFSRFMQFGDGARDAAMPDNADWLAKLNYIEFLRDIGRHFSVNRMLAMDSVKMRLTREHELSFLEFNYMCLQAYDFVELHRRYGCTLQMGGSDQWGNIVTGLDLGRRLGTEQLYALTSPLITTASGAKMGKTAAGAVWLDAAMLSPYEYWQFWRNTEDADVGRFLKLFTLLPLGEIARLEALGGAEINEAKKALANAATALLHGDDAAQAAAATARQTYEEGALAESLPTIDVPSAEFDAGLGVLTAFVRAGLVASTGEARRQIRGGGLRVNDVAIGDEKATIGRDALLGPGVVKLSLGRKKHVLLRAV
jgi:tyrosyl-tRNA synthetase